MRAFVTGATGFIGFGIVKELIAAGHQVTGPSRTEALGKRLIGAGAQELLIEALEKEDTMRMPLSSRILFTLVGLGLPLGAHLADFFSKTHIFNDRWPPHAKFHTGQTLSMSIFLGLISIVFAWRRTDKRTEVLATAAFSAAYAITQMTAILYPGTAFYDPEFALSNGFALGLPRQL